MILGGLARSSAIVAMALLLVSCSGEGREEPRSTDGSDVGAAQSPDSSVFAGTKTEYVELLASCMNEHGWSVTVEHDPATGEAILAVAALSESQGDIYADSLDDCGAELPQRPEPDTDDEIRELFDNWVERYGCMVDAGYTPEQPPSFQVFLDSIRSGTGNWTPGAGLSDADLFGATAACPRDPDSWW